MSIPFLRKLQALQYPDIPTSTSVASPFSSLTSPTFRTLVAWLELTKIRYWPVEQREPIKNVNNPQWNDVFASYLSGLGCPRPYRVDGSMNVEEVHRVMDWLLNQAIGAEFADHAGEYNSLSKMWFIGNNGSTSLAQSSSSSSTSSSTQLSSTPLPLSSSSLSAPEFDTEIANLAKLFQIPLDEKQKATMIRVIRKRIEESSVLAVADAAEKTNRNSSSASAASSSQPQSKGKGGKSTASAAAASARRTTRPKEIEPLPTTREGVFAALDALEKGFPSTTDRQVDHAAQVFRLLFLHDLRNAQNMANELMMLAQEYTSDPKTDAKLGKVGI